MPAPRTDGASGARPEVEGQDLRLLRITEIYPLVMLEDTEGMRDAAVAWQDLGASLDAEARALRRSLAGLAETWQSDAATLFGERGEAAAVSMDRWADVADHRATELYDLAVVVSGKKLRMQWIWDDFAQATDAIIAPPSSSAWGVDLEGAAVAAAADAVVARSRLDDNIEEYTLRALDEVVNPLANRFAEAAASFAERGPLFRGPSDAAVPPDSAYAALMTGEWPPSMASLPDLPPMPALPGGPGAPAVPTQPAVPAVPSVPLAPSAAALALTALPAGLTAPPGALRSSMSAPTMPAGATLSSLVAAGWVGTPGLTGRRAPAVPSASVVPGFGPPGSPTTGTALGTTPPALPGRAGLAAAGGVPAGSHPGGAGLPPGATAPQPPRLPGRSGTSAPSATGPPPPSLPGSTRPRTPATPGSRWSGDPGGPDRVAAPADHHLLGRGAPTSAPPAAPPPSLGTPRRPGARQPARPNGTTSSSTPRVADVDPSVALRSARTTGAGWVPDPAPSRAAVADPRLTSGAPSSPFVPRPDVTPPPHGHPDARTTGGRHRAAVPAGPDPTSLPAAPTGAEERAAERARRRAEWVEARRRHQATLSR